MTPDDSPNPIQPDSQPTPPNQPHHHPPAFPSYSPNKKCSICNSPHRLEIDSQLFYRAGTPRSIATRFPNHSFSAIQRHRTNCWPTSHIETESVIHTVGESSPLPGVSVAAEVLMTKKLARLEMLQRLWDGIRRVIDERAVAYKHMPGGSSGLLAVRPVSFVVGFGKDRKSKILEVAEFDAKLVEKAMELHAAVAKETGEALAWAGKQPPQMLVTGDNPCVLVLGAGAPKPVDAAEARHRVQDTGRRKPLEVPDESVPRPISASMMDIETILDARERALSGMKAAASEAGGDGAEGVAAAEVKLEPADDQAVE